MIKANNTQDTRGHVIGNFPVPNDNAHANIVTAYKNLYAGECQSPEMRDWIYWPTEYLLSDEYKMVKNYLVEKIQGSSDSVIVVGIGGSYLTPQAIIHSEYGEFYNEIAPKKGLPKMYFAGCDLSPDRLNKIIEMVSEGDWSIIYISKSGGTIEPALAFRVLWDALYAKYGEGADGRVYTVTDVEKGTLKGLTNEHGWDSCVIPDGIGGRFSGLTAVGLLPIAVAGIDTDALLKGAIDAMNDCKDNVENFAVKYAEWRYYNGHETLASVEFLATNTPYLSFIAEWIKQLFGESEGKEGKGIFPTSGVLPTDLHSIGQTLQEGERYLVFETLMKRKFKTDIEIPKSDLKDNLDKYEGKKFTQAASAAMEGAFNAHTAGGNPCAMIEIDETLEAMGAFMYYCFVTTAVTAIAMGVNPFNQPGVEFHKVEMKKSPEWDK